MLLSLYKWYYMIMLRECAILSSDLKTSQNIYSCNNELISCSFGLVLLIKFDWWEKNFKHNFLTSIFQIILLFLYKKNNNKGNHPEEI